MKQVVEVYVFIMQMFKKRCLKHLDLHMKKHMKNLDT